MRKIFWIFIVFASLLFYGCKSEYTKAVEDGLASGVINDSLIFGMRMGQTKEDFFRICWDLNKAKLISEGPGNLSAKYLEPYDSTRDMSLRKQMFFYGIFDQKDSMRGMDMTYNYTAWAPWNAKCSSDSLAHELKATYLKAYPGNDYIEIDLGLDKYKAYAKVDGNRQILLYPKSAMEVVVKIEDLRYKYKDK